LAICYITRKEHFNAAHRLWCDDWSEEKNFEVFGKCANKNWHGHNFDLFVTVKGIPDPKTGFIINLKVLSKILKTKVIDVLDHSNLNLDIDFLKEVNPSIENIVVKIWEIIEEDITNLNAKLHCIKLIETENNFVEYYGEK
jgi:6-pyruvoyltetrahydropterin/6-carboxytetrahydropterin synthase